MELAFHARKEITVSSTSQLVSESNLSHGNAPYRECFVWLLGNTTL